MNEQMILESTYYDKAIVYRRNDVKDSVTKQTRQEEVTVNSYLSCALSQNKGGQLSLGGGTGTANSSYILFCPPDSDVKLGDKLLITTALGQQFCLWVGKPFVYSSHMEIPLSSEGRA